MRKLMHSKKGFTLVELMIVVVIMAILVAVAVPIYGAVTKNAEKRSCQSNMRIITENVNQFQMSGGTNGDQIPFATLAKTFTANKKLNTVNEASFTALFNDGIPTCPTAKAQYEVTVTANPNKIAVKCSDATVGTEHNGTATTTAAA